MGKTVRKYILLLLVAGLILAPLLIHWKHLWDLERSYHSAGVSFRQTSPGQVRQTLKAQGIDTAMPGNGNQVLRFSAPKGVWLEDTAFNSIFISAGDTLESDFVSWSHDFFRHRIVQMRVNGRQYAFKLTTPQLTRLYVSALRQNSLEEKFQADTGRRLSYFSAKSTIQALDKTLFERGIHKAYDYPYDRRRVALILGLSVIFALPLSGLLLTLISLAGESLHYQLWLKQYNLEHSRQWDKIAGKLPQFISLREAGLKEAMPVPTKHRLRDRFFHMFRPV